MVTIFDGRKPKIILAAALVAGMILVGMGQGNALDVQDVRNLMQNQVPEEVIINMIRSDGTIYITHEEADSLRALGASENLVAALRPTATTTSPYPATGTVVAGSRGPSIVTGGAAPVPSAPTTAPSMPPATVVESQSAEGMPITAVPITTSAAYPPRYDKEGWVSFSNHDWMPYFLNIDIGKKRMFLSRAPNGGMEIASGQQLVVNVRKESYKLYGDSGEDLKVKVRENETTTVQLNPFGVFGNSGLTGVSVDRDNVRSEVLFGNYVPAPTVVVQDSPVIVVPSPPVYYRHGPYYRPRGNSFYFRYNNW